MKVISLSQEIEKLEKKEFPVKENKKTLKVKTSKRVCTPVKTPKNTHSTPQKSNKDSKVTSQNKNKPANNSNPTPIKKTYTNLPQVRKVAIAKRRTKTIILVALFISCFSLSIFIGYLGPFMLFK